jgi:hypothetical protein
LIVVVFYWNAKMELGRSPAGRLDEFLRKNPLKTCCGRENRALGRFRENAQEITI